MDPLDRLLAAPAAAPAPPDFLDTVHRRARDLRRRRAAAAAGVTACLMLLAFLTGGDRSRSSLEPAHQPLTPAPTSAGPAPSAAPAGAVSGDRSAPGVPSPSASVALPQPLRSQPTVAVPSPDPWYWTVYRGTPPETGQAGLRCADGGGQAFGSWDNGPTGWCYQRSTPDSDATAPRSQQADIWYLGVWLCRASGAGQGELVLDTPLRLVITRGQYSGSGWTDTGEVVFDSGRRWADRYSGGLDQHVAVADNGCVLLQSSWDSRDSAGRALPGGLYFLTTTVADPAFAGWAPYKSTLDYRPGETH